MKTLRILLLILPLWLGCLCAATLEAHLEQERVPLGQAVGLVVTVADGDPTRWPQPPEVAGLSFESLGTSQQFQSINGRSSRSRSFRFAVRAQEEGSYIIPAIELEVGAQVLRTEALELEVGPGPVPSEQEADRFGRLSVNFSEDQGTQVYASELVPVLIEMWFPAQSQVSLRTPPQLSGQDWTLQNLEDQPQQKPERRDGRDWIVVTWHAAMVPIRGGRSRRPLLWRRR